MGYNPQNQYRCTIIRGKAITSMDDLLPFYAETLDEICPIEVSLYAQEFDESLSKKLHTGTKTVKNHRTENVDKILGMVLKEDGLVKLSQRTRKYLEDQDQPLFFKTLCYKFQQPNAGQTVRTFKEDIKHQVRFKPYHFVLALLDFAGSNKIVLTKEEVMGLCLNNLDVMQGNTSIEEVYQEIIRYREKGYSLIIGNPEKNNAWNIQHLREQLHYLRFANLIKVSSEGVYINKNERKVIDYFIKDLHAPLHFDIYSYNLEDKNERKKVKEDWNHYFGGIDDIPIHLFSTSLGALSIPKKAKDSKKKLGDEGEEFVLEYEKDKVRSFNPRLVNRVIHQGTTQGLGYDISSIEASRDVKNPEYARFIEVKSTKRATKPNLEKYWDRVNFTRNEYVAADQHKERYYIYRIYFTSEGVFVAIIKNPIGKKEEGKLFAAPTRYRIEFNNEAVNVIDKEEEV